MKKPKRQRIIMSTGEKRKYMLKLCETEIGILKAALHYYYRIDDFGCRMWSIGNGPEGGSDWASQLIVAGSSKSDGLLQVLDHLSPIEPDFGTNTNKESIHKLLERKLDDYKQKTKEFEEKYGISELYLGGKTDEELKEIEREHAEWKKKQKNK